MHYPVKILKKHLENEYKWLGYEGIASADIKIKEGVRMARERIPQLEDAIKILNKPFENMGYNRAKNGARGEAQPLATDNQLNLFA
jgi:hypothetical protein